MRPRLIALGLLLGCGTWAAACATGSSLDESDEDDDDSSVSAGGAGGTGGEPSSSSSTVSSSGSGGSGGAGGAACDEEPCKLVAPQCGCGPDEACTVKTPTTENPTGRYCDDAGTLAIGESCGAGGDCVPGAFCANAAGYAACLEFCDDDSQCSPPGGLCVMKLTYGANQTEYPDLLMCSTNCDPATNAGCNAGGSCQVAQEQTGLMRFFTICLGSGAGTQGTACTTSSECAAGYGCFTPVNQCLKWCNKQAPSCPAGTGCTDLNPVVTIGSVTYGVCQ